MSDEIEPTGDAADHDSAVHTVGGPAGGAPAPEVTGGVADEPQAARDAGAVEDESGGSVPVDPVRRELAAIDEAMAAARSGVPSVADEPRVPSDDEVAGLEQAHEALRATLDRVERGS